MAIQQNTLRLAAKLERSCANGPGRRAVIWLQGCVYNCPACFNISQKKINAGEDIPIEKLYKWLLSIKGIRGLTISGGEPTAQLPSLLNFLKMVKKETTYSVILFSGRTLEAIVSLPGGQELIEVIDVLIDGPYDLAKANPPGVWPSSANQKIHFLTERYSQTDLINLPLCEIIITKDGEVIKSGLYSV